MKTAWLSIPLLLSIVGLSSSAEAKGIEAAARAAGSERPVARTAAAKSGGGKSSGKAATSKAAASKGPATTKGASKVAPNKSANTAHGNKPATAGNKPATAKLAKQTQAKRPCLARPIQLVRVRGEQVEPHELSLTKCNGAPNLAVLDELSVIARPRDVERPSAAELKAYRARPVAKGKVPKKSKQKFRNPAFVAERVMRVNPGLLTRLQQVASHYPGRIIEVISGYRPDARDTSRHHHGRALDLRVDGIAREKLVDYLRASLDDTGVGYYPNSYFVHMDVRDQKAYWVDRSGPGEPADYGPWPLTPKQPLLDREREDIVKGALAALIELDQPVFRGQDLRSAKVTQPVRKARVREPEQEADDMSADEVKRVRAEARRALDQL